MASKNRNNKPNLQITHSDKSLPLLHMHFVQNYSLLSAYDIEVFFRGRQLLILIGLFIVTVLITESMHRFDRNYRRNIVTIGRLGDRTAWSRGYNTLSILNSA